MEKLYFTILLIICGHLCSAQDFIELSQDLYHIDEVEPKQPHEFFVYPVPVISLFRIDLKAYEDKKITISITDKDGLLRYKSSLSVSDHILQLDAYHIGLKSGIYSVAIRHEDETVTKKLTVL